VDRPISKSGFEKNDHATTHILVLALSVVAYVASFFLPVFETVTFADELENDRILGIEAFALAALLGPITWPAWLANFALPLTWCAYFLRRKRTALICALATLLLAVSSFYSLLSLEYPLGIGFFAWLFASVLMAVATVGESLTKA